MYLGRSRSPTRFKRTGERAIGSSDLFASPPLAAAIAASRFKMRCNASSETRYQTRALSLHLLLKIFLLLLEIFLQRRLSSRGPAEAGRLACWHRSRQTFSYMLLVHAGQLRRGLAGSRWSPTTGPPSGISRRCWPCAPVAAPMATRAYCRRQLLANAAHCPASPRSRVLACGLHGSRRPASTSMGFPGGDFADLKIRPTTLPSAGTS
jgi:hypothetical protein